MYIEVHHDASGNILSCYCADTLPIEPNRPFFIIEGGLPEGTEQARINIDTLTAMAIEAGSGQKAVLDAEGKPTIVNIDRSKYIMDNFIVDVSKEDVPPEGVEIPRGMKVRRLLRRDRITIKK